MYRTLGWCGIMALVEVLEWLGFARMVYENRVWSYLNAQTGGISLITTCLLSLGLG